MPTTANVISLAYLGVKSLMFVGHPQNPPDSAGVLACTFLDVIVKVQNPLPDSVPETQNLLQCRPVFVFLGHNGVILD
jgi:hypothetical protein